MEKEFVPYEQVSSLIALGFNEPVIAHRQHGLDICLLKQPEVLLTDLSMILYQQAFRWFREKYKFYASVVHMNKKNAFYITVYGEEKIEFYFDTYEEAELACLTKLIEIVESKTE
jgi:hypothetical protein